MVDHRRPLVGRFPPRRCRGRCSRAGDSPARSERTTRVSAGNGGQAPGTVPRAARHTRDGAGDEKLCVGPVVATAAPGGSTQEYGSRYKSRCVGGNPSPTLKLSGARRHRRGPLCGSAPSSEPGVSPLGNPWSGNISGVSRPGNPWPGSRGTRPPTDPPLKGVRGGPSEAGRPRRIRK